MGIKIEPNDALRDDLWKGTAAGLYKDSKKIKQWDVRELEQLSSATGIPILRTKRSATNSPAPLQFLKLLLEDLS